ncbi:MAG TPA: hypothetical protein ENN78_00385 [Candidatus Omnitrophica bacterium]|nr:hypothetical protein [Candidatus Omnitrophota bacterium]
MKRIFLLVFLSASTIYAADISIKPQIDKDQAEIGEVLKYSVEVKGSFKSAPSLIVPEPKGFKILSTQTASNYKISGGEVSSTIVYNLMLAAVSEGMLELNGFKVKTDSEEYDVEPLNIEITGATLKPREDKKHPSPKESKKDIWI